MMLRSVGELRVKFEPRVKGKDGTILKSYFRMIYFKDVDAC